MEFLTFVTNQPEYRYFHQTNDVMIKTFLLITLTMIILFACTKESVTAVDLTSVQPMVSFNCGEHAKQYDQVTAAKVRQDRGTIYSFVGTKRPHSENYFNIILFIDSLKPGKYTIGAGPDAFSCREGDAVVNNCFGEVVVTITSNVNGLVNGSFEGTAWSYTTKQLEKVTKGKIENVQLIYY